MFEVFISFGLGYLLGKTVTLGSSTMRKPDKILTWHPESLGYRPVPYSAKIKSNTDYLICYEVKSGNQER